MDEITIIRRGEMTSNGSLRNRDVYRIKHHLLHHNLVLLPSDTCYSLAACAISDDIYKRINLILDRKDEPISIAFPSALIAESFVEFDFYSQILLEKFTPGPITIVCKVKSKKTERESVLEMERQAIVEVVRSKDKTVGVRITDSQIERQVAGCTNYPITTVAVRDERKMIIQDFSSALRRVQDGLKKLKHRPQLIAIEGGAFTQKHSTVVKVEEGAKCTLIRPGEIDFERIKDALRTNFPNSHTEDWT